jgi:hypothetical protein
MQVIDSFTPSNQAYLDDNDLDFGSAALIPLKVCPAALEVVTDREVRRFIADRFSQSCVRLHTLVILMIKTLLACTDLVALSHLIDYLFIMLKWCFAWFRTTSCLPAARKAHTLC